MSIKFWEGDERKSLFVRFDKPHPNNPVAVVWLCREDGAPHPGGWLVLDDGTVCSGVLGSSHAGLSLDKLGRVHPESLAQICAEMAKRIQGD